MNIFYLDGNPSKCAEYHINSHVVKMPVETAQLLSTALHENNIIGPYKKTHIHHPCTKWVGLRDNFNYTLELGMALCREYTHRYKKRHAVQDKLVYISQFIYSIPPGSSSPALAMPDEFKQDDPVEAYRAYYRTKKYDKNGRVMAYWTDREKPEWF